MALKEKTRVARGSWIDENDAPHFSVPELLDHFGWPLDDEHIALVKRGVEDLLAKQGVTAIYQCGAADGGAHGPACPLAL